MVVSYRLLRWNFSSRARQLSGGDAIIVSLPKSGRTWVRAFLCAYFCKRYGRAMTLEPERYAEAGIPRIIYSHDIFEQRTKADFWDRVRGKYLIPGGEVARARLILLVRDPRDAFVSHFLQLTRRTRETPDELKNKTASALLRHRAFGIRSMIQSMNHWLEEFSPRPGFALLRYEALRTNPSEHFRALLAALGETSPEADAFQHALDFSEFANMKKLEAAGAFESKILRPGDLQDPESFKVRRGRVGGFQEYLSAGDQLYAAEALRGLDPRFGYPPQGE